MGPECSKILFRSVIEARRTEFRAKNSRALDRYVRRVQQHDGLAGAAGATMRRDSAGFVDEDDGTHGQRSSESEEESSSTGAGAGEVHARSATSVCR